MLLHSVPLLSLLQDSVRVVGCKARNNISEQNEALGQLILTNNQSEIVQYYTNQSLGAIKRSIRQRSCYNVSFLGKLRAVVSSRLYQTFLLFVSQRCCMIKLYVVQQLFGAGKSLSYSELYLYCI